jgi:site-specific DNA-methyltransferase (adenine-specific)
MGSYAGLRAVEAYVARSLEAAGWEDHGTALKPAYEPILLARKPLAGTMAENVLAYGTGPLNIGAARITSDDGMGRWPSNLAFDEDAVSEINLKDGSRYFFTSKASRKEKEAGLEDFESQTVGDGRKTAIDNAFQRGKTDRKNIHTTVKPIDLMRWLCRLATPKKGGLILDPFAGSGTTGCAAVLEGYEFMGMEANTAYAAIAEARIAYWKQSKDIDLPE